jgi:hypothetical protein
MIQDDIIAYIKTISNITDIVGNRIYWMEAPLSISKACIVVSEVDHDIVYNLDVDRSPWQISAHSKDKSECVNLQAYIVQNFKNYAGEMNGRYVVSTYINSRLIRDDSWWHSPTRVQIKYQED